MEAGARTCNRKERAGEAGPWQPAALAARACALVAASVALLVVVAVLPGVAAADPVPTPSPAPTASHGPSWST